MKNLSTLFLIIFIFLALSACKDDDEPEPRPQSYIEYAGRIYELRTAMFISRNSPHEKQLLMQFYSLEKDQLNAILDPESGQFMEGHIITLHLSSSLSGEVGEGSYTYSNNDHTEFSIYNADIIIQYDAMQEAGIFLYPIAGTVNFQKQAEGHLVTFDFTLSNEDKVTGQYIGELEKTN